MNLTVLITSVILDCFYVTKQLVMKEETCFAVN